MHIQNKHHSAGTLLSKIKREIAYPSATPRGYIFKYTSAILLTSVFFLVSIIFKTEALTALLLSLAVVCAAWVGGFGGGLLSSTLSVVFLFLLFYYPRLPNINLYLESILLLLTGMTAGLSIHFSKKINQLNRFNEKEKLFLKRVAEIEAENEKLRAEIKSRDEFLSIASHELKTPLTATLLKIQIALHNIRNTSLANFSVQNLMDMLLSSEQQTQRLAKMINDLLNVSLMRTGRMELELEKADLTEVTKNVIKSLIEKAKKENIEIRMKSVGVVEANIDVMRMEQVLTNLITNAMKYGRQKPIDITVTKSNSMGKIAVTDYGIGIPKEQQEKIFVLFERGVHDGQKNGLGVGLYITNQIVKAHHGKLHVDSKEGKGTTFSLEVPLN